MNVSCQMTHDKVTGKICLRPRLLGTLRVAPASTLRSCSVVGTDGTPVALCVSIRCPRSAEQSQTQRAAAKWVSHRSQTKKKRSKIHYN